MRGGVIVPIEGVMPAKETPFFSVIIPTFDRKDFLHTAIMSVLDQTFPDFELIVVDDGSSDGTGEMVEKVEDKRLKYIYQENHGVAHARNKALKRSKGDFIALLDSDDRWVPEKLSRAFHYIKQFPDIKIFHTEEVWFRQGKILNQKRIHSNPSGFVYQKALPMCCISISTAVARKDVFNTVGGFDESLEACEDYDLWLRATHRYEVKLIPECLTIKDGGRPDQLSSRIWGLDRFRIRALVKMLDSGILDKEDYQATYAQLTRKCKIFALGARKRGREEQGRIVLSLIDKYASGT